MDCSYETLAAELYEARAQGLAYRVPKTADIIKAQIKDFPKSSHSPIPLSRYEYYEVSIDTNIGSRVSQEDRLTFCPELIKGHPDAASFFGVFDGTVGDFASDTVKDLVIPHLINSRPWKRIVELLTSANDNNNNTKNSEPNKEEDTTICDSTTTALQSRDAESDSEAIVSQENADGKQLCHRIWNREPESSTTTSESINLISHPINQENKIKDELPGLLWRAMEWMYLNADTELLDLCSQNQKDYASSTSVTVILAGGYGCTGHVGDSRIAIGYEKDGFLYGEFLTEDHKPNVFYEQERILRYGGSVEYLHNHNNKPFIRGGDFTIRKSRGDQPMQLQYSRAFGGKDLKMYGLSNEPDLKVFKIEPSHHVLILASDGIWDVHSAGRTVEIAMMARRRGEDPATSIIQVTLNEQRLKNQNADNLTVIVVFLDGAKYHARWQTST